MEVGSLVKVVDPPGTEPRYYRAGMVPGIIGWEETFEGGVPGYAKTKTSPFRPMREAHPTEEEKEEAWELTPPWRK